MYVPGFGQVLLGATVVVVGGYAVYKGGSWIYKKIKKVVKKKKIKGKSVRYSKSKAKSGTRNKKKSKTSKKEKADDPPSWARKEKPRKGENGNQYAKRKMDERYGRGRWTKKGTKAREYSKLKKWADRHDK